LASCINSATGVIGLVMVPAAVIWMGVMAVPAAEHSLRVIGDVHALTAAADAPTVNGEVDPSTALLADVQGEQLASADATGSAGVWGAELMIMVGLARAGVQSSVSREAGVWGAELIMMVGLACTRPGDSEWRVAGVWDAELMMIVGNALRGV
jgi:hypothetical protein